MAIIEIDLDALHIRIEAVNEVEGVGWGTITEIQFAICETRWKWISFPIGWGVDILLFENRIELAISDDKGFVTALEKYL